MHPATPVPQLKAGSLEFNVESLKFTKSEGKMEWTTTTTSDGSTLRLLPLYKAVDMRFADYLTLQGELSSAPLTYPTDKISATPVTELQDGEE